MDGRLGSPGAVYFTPTPSGRSRAKAVVFCSSRASLGETVNSAYSAELNLNNGTHSSAERLNSRLNASRASVDFPARATTSNDHCRKLRFDYERSCGRAAYTRAFANRPPSASTCLSRFASGKPAESSAEKQRARAMRFVRAQLPAREIPSLALKVLTREKAGRLLSRLNSTLETHELPPR